MSIGHIVIGLLIGYFVLRFLFNKQNDKKMWNQWEHAQELIKNDSSLYLGQVVRIRQHARTGTKAYIRWIEGNASEAIWAPEERLHPGNFIVATGSEGGGNHHSEPVFFINDIKLILHPEAYNGWNRYNKKLAKLNMQKEQKTAGVF